MQTTTRDGDGERILTIRFDEPAFDADTMDALSAVIDGAEREGGSLVFVFDGDAGKMVGDFPRPAAPREDLAAFARWEDLLSRISKLKVKTIAAYRGWIGPAAVQLGLVVDLRVASSAARLEVGQLRRGRFPGTSAYWLPKFVGLGAARRLLLLGGALGAEEAARLGLLDALAQDLADAVDRATAAMRPLEGEAVYFLRRVLDESYRHERASAVEQIKAARHKLGSST